MADIIKVSVETRMSEPCLAKFLRTVIRCKATIRQYSLVDGDYVKEGNVPVTFVVHVPAEKYKEFCALTGSKMTLRSMEHSL